MAGPDIAFVRLTEVDPAVIALHMSDPRTLAHMPLATGTWDADRCAEFVAAKEACWARDGLGHQAILADGEYGGWGGFQKEGDEWDFGLVLTPDRFGLGQRIVRAALAQARQDPRIGHATFLLPFSRRHLGGLARLGARHVGDVDYDGTPFRKFRIELA